MISDAKEKIRRAAVELFAQKGFSGTSIRQICSKAEVNIAMVKYYFGSKISIYDYLLDDFFSRLYSFLMETGILEEEDLHKRIEITFEKGNLFIKNNMNMILILTREIMDKKNLKKAYKLEKIIPLFSAIWGRPENKDFSDEILPGLSRDIASMVLTGIFLVPVIFKDVFYQSPDKKFEDKEYQKKYSKTIAQLFFHGLKSFVSDEGVIR